VKIATFNCNSVRVRLGQIASWLAREAPDVLCLQETKVQDQDFPVAAFRNAGYHVVFRGRKAYAGVAIASREEPREVAFGLGCGSGFSPDDCGEPDEDRLIRAAIGGVTVVNTYVPQGRSADSPHFASKLEWLRRFRRLLEREYSPAEPLVWCGDLNVAPEPIDVHDPKRLKEHPDFHPLARAALEEVRAWGFTDVYRLFFPNAPGHYTFWDYRFKGTLERNAGWRVDHIWATRPLTERARRAWIDVKARRAERPSDHTFVVAEFDD
jgi:exodeoxyribonuclease-3